jgi:hypothetical protein
VLTAENSCGSNTVSLTGTAYEKHRHGGNVKIEIALFPFQRSEKQLNLHQHRFKIDFLPKQRNEWGLADLGIRHSRTSFVSSSNRK